MITLGVFIRIRFRLKACLPCFQRTPVPNIDAERAARSNVLSETKGVSTIEMAQAQPSTQSKSRRFSRVQMHEFEKRSRQELVSGIKNQAKELCFFFSLFLVYVLFGALVFFYIEECSGAPMADDGSTPSLHDEKTPAKFKNITKTCSLLYEIFADISSPGNSNLTQFLTNCTLTINNSVDSFIEKGFTTTCIVDEFQMLKYAEYAIFTLLTVGYGNTTPVTIIGRYVMILYATFGVPIAVSMYSVAGKLLVQIFTFFIRFSEEKLLRRPSNEKTLQAKVLIVSILAMVAIMLLGSSITMRDDMENWTFSTSIYFWFVSLTTIGYGDIHFDRLKHLSSIHFLLLSAGNLLFGLGISAAIIESFALALEKRENLIFDETDDNSEDRADTVMSSVSSGQDRSQTELTSTENANSQDDRVHECVMVKEYAEFNKTEKESNELSRRLPWLPKRNSRNCNDLREKREIIVEELEDEFSTRADHQHYFAEHNDS